jgi:hypothetical protein
MLCELLHGLLRGAAAGAAGTSALDASTYADMALRGRPPSSAPQKSVEHMAAGAHVDIPGQGQQRENRVSGLGSLSGILTGVSVGALYGGVRALGVRPPTWVGALIAAGTALVAANGPMAAMGITDPRSWSRADWISDLVPHACYGAVTAFTYAATER